MKYLIALGVWALIWSGVSAVAALPNSKASDHTSESSLETLSEHSSGRDRFYFDQRFGFRFIYPSRYVIENATDQAPDNEKIMDQVEVLEIWRQADYLNRAHLSESPPTIRIVVYNNPQQHPLQHWKDNLSRDNDHTLTIAGQEAIAYTATGLYESDNVLFASPDGQYIFHLRGSYLHTDDVIRQTFQDILSSFSFDVLPSTTSSRINYSQLQSLLSAKNWQAADVETRAILQRLAQNSDYLFGSATLLNTIPCSDLHMIDQLWSQANVRFGYTAQQRIWQKTAITANTLNARVDQFGQMVGWRRTAPEIDPIALELSSTQWKFDQELDFGSTAPVGQFPWAGVSSSRLIDLLNEAPLGCGSCTIDAIYLSEQRFYDYIPALFDRLKACQMMLQPMG